VRQGNPGNKDNKDDTNLKNKNYFKKSIYVTLICIVCLCISCVHPHREYKAYIGNKTPAWQMIENCGYEGCYPLVDILIGNDMKVRFDFYRIQNGKLIFVKFTFLEVAEGLSFNPAKISAVLDGKNHLQVRGFKCRDAIWDLRILKSMPAIQTPVKIAKNDCYLIFIDYQELNEELIAMNIDNALTLNKRNINVPIINFKRNPLGDK